MTLSGYPQFSGDNILQKVTITFDNAQVHAGVSDVLKVSNLK
jgi:hypothetical protein